MLRVARVFELGWGVLKFFPLCAAVEGSGTSPGLGRWFSGRFFSHPSVLVTGALFAEKARLICGSEPKAVGARMPKAVRAMVNVPFSRDLGV